MDNNDNNNFSGAQFPKPDSDVTTDKTFSDSVDSSVTPASPVDADKSTASPRKHRAPVGAIILAVIVAGTLAAATIYAYRQSNKPAVTETAETSDTVNGSDVDATADEVDQTVNEMDSTSDFVESELSDTTLGL